ncbi:integrase core domain-containing protein [Chloroflexota bacterium]
MSNYQYYKSGKNLKFTLCNYSSNREIFITLTEVYVLIEQWGRDHNEVRPHSSLKGSTPKEYAGAATGL